jgi:hypothetical protein
VLSISIPRTVAANRRRHSHDAVPSGIAICAAHSVGRHFVGTCCLNSTGIQRGTSQGEEIGLAVPQRAAGALNFPPDYWTRLPAGRAACAFDFISNHFDFMALVRLRGSL